MVYQLFSDQDSGVTVLVDPGGFLELCCFLMNDVSDETQTQRDPHQEIIDSVRAKLGAGNFRQARLLLEHEIQSAPGRPEPLLETRDKMKIDAAAVTVAGLCALALLLISSLTLFH